MLHSPFFLGGAQSANATTWSLIGHFFGRKSYGLLRGGITLAQSLLSAGAIIGAGWIFDRTGTYTSALVASGILYILAAVIFWNLRAPGAPKVRDAGLRVR